MQRRSRRALLIAHSINSRKSLERLINVSAQRSCLLARKLVNETTKSSKMDETRFQTFEFPKYLVKAGGRRMLWCCGVVCVCTVRTQVFRYRKYEIVNICSISIRTLSILKYLPSKKLHIHKNMRDGAPLLTEGVRYQISDIYRYNV